MKTTETLLADTVVATLAIYAEMRRRTADEQAAAEQELRHYFLKLIAEGEANREALMVKGLTHLRRREERPGPVPVWMRQRSIGRTASTDPS